MRNYRDFRSRTECLINALLWTLTSALQLIFFLVYTPAMGGDSMALVGLLLLLQLSSAVFHWHRYLTYDKINRP